MNEKVRILIFVIVGAICGVLFSLLIFMYGLSNPSFEKSGTYFVLTIPHRLGAVVFINLLNLDHSASIVAFGMLIGGFLLYAIIGIIIALTIFYIFYKRRK